MVTRCSSHAGQSDAPCPAGGAGGRHTYTQGAHARPCPAQAVRPNQAQPEYKAAWGEREAAMARDSYQERQGVTDPEILGGTASPRYRNRMTRLPSGIFATGSSSSPLLDFITAAHAMTNGPSFDAEWPRAGVRIAGALAGVCETIQRVGLTADGKGNECCWRCAARRSTYRRQYCEENLQHLGLRPT